MKKFVMLVISWLLATGLAFAQVNINTAKKDELDGLKGIGPTKAQAIIDYRRKNGPFRTVDDLQNVPGIGPATLKDLRQEVTVTGASHPVVAAPVAAPSKRVAEPVAVAVADKTPAPAMPKPASPVTPAVAPAKPPMPAAPVAAAKPAAPAMDKPVNAQPAIASPAAPAKPAQPAGASAKPASVSPPANPVTLAAPASPAKPGAPAQPAKPANPATKPAQ